MLKKVLLSMIGLGVLALLGSGLGVFSKQPEKVDVVDTNVDAEPVAKRDLDQSSKSSPEVVGAPSQSVAVNKTSPAVSHGPSQNEVQVAILDKMKLKKKVFKSASEEMELLRVVKDPEVFKMSSAYLKDENNWDKLEFESTQNELTELFKMGFEQNSSAAYEQALAIISDERVEAKNLSESQRTVLAGIQAELMFYLLAYNPGYEASVRQVAQGPVRERLLQNVNSQLNTNHQDSLLEKDQYDKGKWN